MLSKKAIVLIILVLYLFINLWLGIRTSRKSAKENADKGFLSNYFAGSRSMGGVVLAMTLVATYTSASSFLGGPGLASSFGMSWSWVAGVQIGAAFLTLGVLGKKFAMIAILMLVYMNAAVFLAACIADKPFSFGLIPNVAIPILCAFAACAAGRRRLGQP